MATFVRTQSIAHRIGERGRLIMKVTSADVRLKGAPGDEASVRVTFEIAATSDEEADRIFEELKLRADAGGSQLLIEEQDVASGVGSTISRLVGGRGQVEVTMEGLLPQLAELRLEGASADVQVEGLRGEQRYSTISGDLYLIDLGGSVRVNSVSGDITIRATEPIDVRVEVVSGDLSVIAPRLDGLRATSVSGDQEVEGELGGGEFRVETVSGDLSVGLVGGATFEVRGLSTDIRSELDHRIEGRRDRRRVLVGGGGPEFAFRSMSGDLEVRRPRRVEGGHPHDRGADQRAPAAALPSPDEQLAVLRALEAGEIDVDEATRRLAGSSDA